VAKPNPRQFGRSQWAIKWADGTTLTIWANQVKIATEGRLVVLGSTPTNRMADAEDLLMAYQPSEWRSFFNIGEDGSPINQ
jgi:hypothetical protein